MTELERHAPNVAWEDPPAAELEDFVATSRAVGWQAALDVESSRRPVFTRRLRNLSLGNWHLLLRLPRASRVVDVGCGFGSLVLGLADYFRLAVGVDLLSSRVAYAAMRARQDGRDRAAFARVDGFKLPFGDGAIDFVSMNGVLEWAGLYVTGAPRELQLAILREMRRVLGSTGTLGVAVENRFAMETLVGMADTHTQLRLVPALPRFAAAALSRVARRQPYRTYLYDAAGYRRLLGAAGFRVSRVYDLVSSYNDYDFVVDPADGGAYRLLWERRLVRTFFARAGRARRALAGRWPAALGRVGYAFLLLAGSCVPTLLDADHDLWRRAADAGVAPGRGRFASQGTSVGSMAVVTHDGRRPTGVVELSIGAAGDTGQSVMPPGVATALGADSAPVAAWTDDGLTVRCFTLAR
jgi:ubiquinone/menaquinone biosynthesis C-methylase UbiE